MFGIRPCWRYDVIPKPWLVPVLASRGVTGATPRSLMPVEG
jgi:hypothetical protein